MIVFDGKNFLVRYEMVVVLMSEENYDVALAEFNKL